MKQLRIFSLISCLVIAVYFLIVSFSGISIAEQTSVKKCISNCSKKQQVCLNINADKRSCNVEFQNCVDACNKESEPSSEQPSTPQGSNRNLKPM
ncbi:MAG: hypothetical protein ABSF13_04610 [Smithella sp.]